MNYFCNLIYFILGLNKVIRLWIKHRVYSQNIFTIHDQKLLTYYTPRFNDVERGGILVSPCPSVGPSVCPSVDRIVSALYLQQYSLDPFHICTSNFRRCAACNVCLKIKKFEILANSLNV